MRPTQRFALLLAALLSGGCDDILGPDRDDRPGRRVLSMPDYTVWTWLDEDEILYGTPYDYAEATPHPRLEAADLDGDVRTVASVTTGDDWIVPYRFARRGAHVYFEVVVDPDNVALYRAPVGGGAAEPVLDSVPYGPAVSPDERKVAWVDPGLTVVVVDLASGERTEYPLDEWATDIAWARDASGLIVHLANSSSSSSAGNHYQWLDLRTGAIHGWTSPPLGEANVLEVAWVDGSPWLYSSGAGVTRYSIATGAVETLSSAPGRAAGWSGDRSIVALVQEECLEWSIGPFGGNCLRWRTRVDRIDLATDERRRVIDFTGDAQLFPQLSPDGEQLAYDYRSGGGGWSTDDGVFVLYVGD